MVSWLVAFTLDSRQDGYTCKECVMAIVIAVPKQHARGGFLMSGHFLLSRAHTVLHKRHISWPLLQAR